MNRGMNVEMAVEYANFLDNYIENKFLLIDEYNAKKTISKEFEYIVSIDEKIKKLNELIDIRRKRISVLVDKFKIKRCVYCNEWTHDEIDKSVHYQSSIYCNERCKKNMDEDFF